MEKRKALELKPGDSIIYGPTMWSRDAIDVRRGTVQHVTRKGGIQVQDTKGRVEWVPYHNVLRVG